jgi:hypothetical protein
LREGRISTNEDRFPFWSVPLRRLTYGLGTENQNLPGFIILCPGKSVVGIVMGT